MVNSKCVYFNLLVNDTCVYFNLLVNFKCIYANLFVNSNCVHANLFVNSKCVYVWVSSRSHDQTLVYTQAYIALLESDGIKCTVCMSLHKERRPDAVCY